MSWSFLNFFFFSSWLLLWWFCFHTTGDPSYDRPRRRGRKEAKECFFIFSLSRAPRAAWLLREMKKCISSLPFFFLFSHEVVWVTLVVRFTWKVIFGNWTLEKTKSASSSMGKNFFHGWTFSASLVIFHFSQPKAEEMKAHLVGDGLQDRLDRLRVKDGHCCGWLSRMSTKKRFPLSLAPWHFFTLEFLAHLSAHNGLFHVCRE